VSTDDQWEEPTRPDTMNGVVPFFPSRQQGQRLQRRIKLLFAIIERTTKMTDVVITPIEVTRQHFDADVGLRTSTQRIIVAHNTQHRTTTAIRIVQ